MLELFSVPNLLGFVGVTRYWVVLLVLCGAYEKQQLCRRIEAAKAITVGASEKEVATIIGQPSKRWEKRGEPAATVFGKVPSKWAYRRKIDFESFFVAGDLFPNLAPVRLHLWGSDDRDLIIEWREDRTVAKVVLPREKCP